MQVIKEGDYKLKDWSLETECTGNGYDENKHKPCHSILKLEDGDIVAFYREKPKGYGTVEYWISYGFICCKCGCFTEVSTELIPNEIQKYCLRVAKKEHKYYTELSEEEKELSKNL